MQPFSRSHPECLTGEIYIGNGSLVVFKKKEWKTKRMGRKAYDLTGQPISGVQIFPMFVQRIELEEAGVIAKTRSTSIIEKPTTTTAGASPTRVEYTEIHHLLNDDFDGHIA